VSTVAEQSGGPAAEQVLEAEGLSRADRTALLLRAVHAATSARERAQLELQVIETNMVVAGQIATRYRGRGIAHDDLEQVAYLALVKAVRRYEFAEDRNFLSFAVPTIRGEIRRYFRDQGWTIRPPRSVQEAQTRIRGVEDELLHELGRAPRPSEIAGRSGLDVGLVVEALAATGCFTPSSLEGSATDEGGRVQEFLGDDDPDFGRAEARTVLAPLLARLTRRERLMLEMHFFRGATQKEIGDTIGVTQMQVSRLLSDLMGRLREQLLSADELDECERRPAAWA
jgi:RNA polymerase sigma-B factor